MNTSHFKLIFLLCVGLLTMPGTAYGIAVSNAPVCLQADEGNAEAVDSLSLGGLEPNPNSLFPRPSSRYIQPLQRAIRIFNEGDVNDAAEQIGQFLVDSGEQDFLILTDVEQGTATSVTKFATEMLGRLPKSAIENYRIRFGVQASQRLSLAIVNSDYFEIAQISRRYPYTDAGVEAAILMGHYHLDAGRALLAAESFQTALDLGRFSKRPDPQLYVLTAVAWSLARHPDLAETAISDLAKANGGKFRFGDQDISIDADDPLAAIKAVAGAGTLKSASTVDQWLLVGGNASRGARTSDGFPVGQPLWKVDVTGSPEDAQKIKTNRKTIANNIGKNSLVPANVPLIVDGLVLVGSQKQISAVDFKTGKRIWSVATADIPEDTFKQVSRLPAQFRNIPGRGTPPKSFDRRPWSDFLRGHVSSDGKHIFHIVKTLGTPRDRPNNGIIASRRVPEPVTINSLQAIDMQAEGELVWEIGSQATGDPLLDKVVFLGAPLPIDGVLYAIAHHLEEVVLVALNAEDGKLIWLQPLASKEEIARRRFSMPVPRQDHSLTPSYSDGILVCPTGANTLVAVDTIARRVLWGAQSKNASNKFTKPGVPSTELQDAQVFVENSRVVTLDVSVNSDARLLAMSLLDGSPLMESGKAGEQVKDVLHVASVDESRVVLVERSSIRAISSSSGRQLWATSIQKFGPPAGRGYVSQEALYLPTEGRVILKIDLKSGDIIDSVMTNQPLGNLIVHQGRVISRSETSVACFDLDSKVVAEVDAAAKAVGGIENVTPMLKLKQTALLRSQGQVEQAVELLETIAEADRSSRFKLEFIQTATLLLDTEPEYAVKLLRKYQDAFKFETAPKKFLRYVELLVEYGMTDDAVNQLCKDNAFFNQTEADPILQQRPLVDYNLDATDADEVVVNAKAKEEQPNEPKKDEPKKEKTEKDESKEDKPTKDKPDKDKPKENKTSSADNATESSSPQIGFEQSQWAKAQLIRIARDYPKSVPQIRAAIERQLSEIDQGDALLAHRFLRKFPLELVAPQVKFDLANRLIDDYQVAEAENLLASLLGFLPSTAEQLESAETEIDGLSSDSIAELWMKIHDAQYGLRARSIANAEVAELAERDYNRVDVKSTNASSRLGFPTVVQPRGELAGKTFAGKEITIWGNAEELEILSPTGKPEARFQMFKNGRVRGRNLRTGSGWLQMNHSLAILRQQDWLVALDLSKIKSGQSPVIWTRNLAPSRKMRLGFNDELDLIVSTALPVEDVTASFPATGCCCFIDDGKLTCVDAFTGKTLWSRASESGHENVMANDRQVVTTDPKLNQCSIYDLRTGERLQRKPISDLVDSLWTIDGLSCLVAGTVQQRKLDWLGKTEDFRPEVVDAYDENSKTGRLLSRYDFESGDFVWKKVFHAKAKISRLSEGRFIVLSDDGQLYIFDAKTGKQLAKFPSGLTEAQRQKVQFLGTTEHFGKDLIVMANHKKGTIPAGAYTARASWSLGTFFSGHLMLISKNTLEPVWDNLAEVDGFQLQPMLPSTSPLLVLSRQIQPIKKGEKKATTLGRPKALQKSLQFLAIDMQTGRSVADEVLGPIGLTRFSSPTVDLSAGVTKVQWSNGTLEFKLEKSSDEPPAPVASVTNVDPVPLTRVPSAKNAKANAAKNGQFDIEESNERLTQQAKDYEATLEQRRKQERALLEKEAE
ncbi:PQQ-binding-like beta-propeller repeat protein [Mariniblastus sp.]|nr:PQQ-binding-like beta-propeller repeat protein [Mariniblastus sp.]